MKSEWTHHAVSPEEAVSHVPSGAHVFVHGASATPVPLVTALAARKDVQDVSLYHLHLAGGCEFVAPENRDRFRSVSLFTGPALREPIAEGWADFVPVFLSDIPALFTQRRIPVNVALLQLSPPDAHGMCSLGTSVDVARAAAESADVVIAEINERMPRTHGYTAWPMSRVDHWVHSNRALQEHAAPHIGDVENEIGEQVAALVEDGSTIQMGIGAIPDAALLHMRSKLGLGVHSEMFSDNLVDLYEAGAITGEHKKVHRGRIVTSFVTGSQKVFDFVDDNLLCEFHPADKTNDTALIRKNPRVVAINSAIEVDLTGQVCADSLGHRIFSGIGGQMDFIRGAAKSVGGKPVIALPSTAAKGKVSRITPLLKPGAGVVTTRGHVHWVVTEYGAVNLFGLSLRRRAEALIGIAHPDFRAELTQEIVALRHFPLTGPV